MPTTHTTFMQQTVNNSVWNFSQFQISHCAVIEQRPGFEQWCSTFQPTLPEPRKTQAFIFVWRENGKTCGQRIGAKKVLGEVCL